MLRTLAAAGVPTPLVEGEHEGVLLLQHIDNDGVFSPLAWADIGAATRELHAVTGESYGWSVDYALGSVALDNRQRSDWPGFRSEEHTSELQSLMRISYAVFCLKKKT